MKKVNQHHFLDRKTVNFIKNNKPSFNLDNSIELNLKLNLENFILIVRRYTPNLNWYLVEKQKDTIHGIRHILRVIFNSLLLVSISEVKSPKHLQNSLIASSLHDLRRKNDLLDFAHGKRTAKWFKENFFLIEKQYGVHLSQEDVNELYFAIKLHDSPYEKIKNNSSYKKYKNLIDLLKTADALDRYRLPKKEWWLNEKYIKLIPPDNLKLIAFELVVSSEMKFLDGSPSIESFFTALEELNQLEL